jgi:predicted nucleotidyltransferase
MSNSSEITFRDLKIPNFIEVFGIVEEVLKTHGAPYYLIGVSAIALRLAQEGQRPARGTKDIDFAIMVSSFAEYDAIKDSLLNRGFNQAKMPWTLYHDGYNVAIDLLPYGQIEENDTINFTDRAVNVVVLGFRESLEEAEEIRLDEKFTVHVPPLHGMCMLKLIAWADRPEIRGTDLEDIYYIVSKYYEVSIDEIMEYNPELLDKEPFNRMLIAARMLGRKIATALGKSEPLKERVMGILNDNTLNPSNSKIGEAWARKHELDLEEAVEILNELKLGIVDILQKTLTK